MWYICVKYIPATFWFQKWFTYSSLVRLSIKIHICVSPWYERRDYKGLIPKIQMHFWLRYRLTMATIFLYNNSFKLRLSIYTRYNFSAIISCQRKCGQRDGHSTNCISMQQMYLCVSCKLSYILQLSGWFHIIYCHLSGNKICRLNVPMFVTIILLATGRCK